MLQKFYKLLLKDEDGVVLVLVALLMFAFLGIAALVIDISVLHLGKNELQKAADAGALAGARDLYFSDGSAVNPDANTVAQTTAIQNQTTGGIAVEVASGDVQRGHWSFGLGDLPRGFYPNNSTSATVIAGLSEVELDEDPDFINAVRVVARRQATLIPAFFSGIFGHSGFEASAEAVAYLGYAGNLDTDEVDYPLAICEDSILVNGNSVDCTVGTYLSGGNQTARWTNFVQPCSGAANAPSVWDRMNPCGVGNSDPIYFGQGVTTMKGTQASSGFAGPHNMTDCWKASDASPQSVPRSGPGNPKPLSYPDEPWPIKLLVVDCDGDESTPTCLPVTGVVSLNVLWMTTPDEHSKGYVPLRMAGLPGWESDPNIPGPWDGSSIGDYQDRWNDFADHFNLLDPDGNPASYESFTLYFHQDCKVHEPTGGTGGTNYGVMAKVPVLVR